MASIQLAWPFAGCFSEANCRSLESLLNIALLHCQCGKWRLLGNCTGQGVPFTNSVSMLCGCRLQLSAALWKWSVLQMGTQLVP